MPGWLTPAERKAQKAPKTPKLTSYDPADYRSKFHKSGYDLSRRGNDFLPSGFTSPPGTTRYERAIIEGFTLEEMKRIMEREEEDAVRAGPESGYDGGDEDGDDSEEEGCGIGSDAYEADFGPALTREDGLDWATDGDTGASNGVSTAIAPPNAWPTITSNGTISPVATPQIANSPPSPHFKTPGCFNVEAKPFVPKPTWTSKKVTFAENKVAVPMPKPIVKLPTYVDIVAQARGCGSKNGAKIFPATPKWEHLVQLWGKK